MKRVTFVLTAVLLASPAYAQIGAIRRGAEAAKKAGELVFTDAEKRDLGTKISAQLRERYGVVQDPKVTKYVTLVGLTVAKNSSQASLPWQFIVLDTDAVNAYAAPGGFIHITRGALGLIQNEAELAGVLGHEIAHITENHTVDAIRKAKGMELAADATRNQLLDQAANKGYEILFENAFDRGDELAADKAGVGMVGKAGYAAGSLSGFLTRLAERNKDVKEPNGLFASHPLIKERTDRIGRAVTDGKFTSAASVQPRYASFVSYKPVALSAIATVAAPAAEAEQKSRGLGVGRLRNALSSGSQRQSTQVSASAGARGVGPDRDAKGGPNKGAVRVTVTDAELATFKAGIA